MLIYYTVFDSKGNKIADCGNENDAKWLSDQRKGTYKTVRFEFSQTIEVKALSNLELPTRDIVPKKQNKDCNSKNILTETELEPFIVNYHD